MRFRHLAAVVIAFTLFVGSGVAVAKHALFRPAAQPAYHGPTIRIGVVTALTGFHAFEGQATRQGYEFWSSWVNDHGGIPIGHTHYRIELIERDDESSPLLTTQLVERLINEEQVSFILGPYGSSESLAAAAVAERKAIPMVTGTGASEKIFQQGYHEVFGVMSPARRYLRGMIDLAHQARPRAATVAVIAANDTFSLEAQQGALQRAHETGMRVLLSDQYRPGTLSFSAIATRIAQAKPDVILQAGHFEESVSFMRALYEANVHAKIYGEAVGAELPAFSRFLDAVADDTLSAAQWTPTQRVSGSGSLFLASAPAYAKAFLHYSGHQAGSENASASAAGLALELALHEAGTTDPKRVRRSLAALQASTFYGEIAFDAQGLNVSKPMYVNQLEDVRRYTVYPKSYADAAFVYPARGWLDR